MIKKILNLISQGNITFAELAKRLEINDIELRNRLELMEHMGYLKNQASENCVLESKCNSCPQQNDSCPGNVYKQNLIITQTYQLTKKGKHVCDK